MKISSKKTVLIVLIILNTAVLLGQIWPEGAPPFAGAVNILFLFCSLLFFTYALRNIRKGQATVKETGL